ASISGTLFYVANEGALLYGGSGQLLTVVFVPTDTQNYSVITAQVSITVLQAAPTLSVVGGTFVYNGMPHGATVVAYGIGGPSDSLTPYVSTICQGIDGTFYGPTTMAP